VSKINQSGQARPEAQFPCYSQWYLVYSAEVDLQSVPFHTSPLTYISKRATWRETYQNSYFVINSILSVQAPLLFLRRMFWFDVKLACAANGGHKDFTVKVRWIEFNNIILPSPMELMPLLFPSLRIYVPLHRLGALRPIVSETKSTKDSSFLIQMSSTIG
jgi:hypothetical protein